MFVLSEPVYPRSSVEKAFLGLYGISALINFAAIVITLASYKDRLDQTYSSFSGRTATLTGNLAVLLQGCGPYSSTEFSLGGMSVAANIDKSSAPVLFASNSLAILGVIVVMIFIFLNDLFAKACFGGNIRNFRIRGVTIPVNTIAANAMLVQSIGILILIGTTSSSRSFLNSYVQHCATIFSTNNRTAFLELENDVQNVFGTDLGLIVVAVSINLAFYFFAFVALCVEAFSDAASQFEGRKYYWETNNFGVPSNKELFHYSKWRRFALEELDKGAEIELAPVSYLNWIRDLEEAKKRWANDPKHYFYGNKRGGSRRRHPGSHDQKQQQQQQDDDDDDFELDDDEENFLAEHDEFDDESGGGAGTNSAVPQSVGGNAAGAPLFNPWKVSGDDAPEELVMPEAFEEEDEGDFFDDDDDGGAIADRHQQFPYPSSYGLQQQQHQQQPYSNRAASAGALSPTGQRDRPYRRSTSNQQPQHMQDAAFDAYRQQHRRVNETEEERKERHRLRRMNETEEERAARKARKQRVQELVARSSSARGALPPPLPSP